VDVNGDGLATPLDALQVVNYLNQAGAAEGEGQHANSIDALFARHGQSEPGGRHGSRPLSVLQTPAIRNYQFDSAVVMWRLSLQERPEALVDTAVGPGHAQDEYVTGELGRDMLQFASGRRSKLPPTSPAGVDELLTMDQEATSGAFGEALRTILDWHGIERDLLANRS